MKIRKGISYSRVSTQGQLVDESGERKEDSSLDSQKRRINDYIDSKNSIECKFEIVDYCEDEGLSGSTMEKRPAFLRMWKEIEKKSVDFIIATELTRLSRSTKDFLSFMDHCKKHDVVIFLLKEGFDPTTMQGKMMATITALFSEFERESTIHRVRENAKSRLKTKGRINGGAPILGLVRSKNAKEIYEVDYGERDRLLSVLHIYLNSSGKSETLRRVKELKIYDSGNKDFTLWRLNNLLSNARWRYSGKWYLKDSKTKEIYGDVELSHGPLIDLKLAEKVISKLKEEAEAKLGCGRSDRRYLLTGLLFDKRGNKFYGSKGNGRGGSYYYYYCKESKIRVNSDEIEKSALNYMIQFTKKSHSVLALLDKSYAKRTKEVRKEQAKVTELKKEMKDIDSDILHQKKLLKDKHITADSINMISNNVKEMSESKLVILSEIDLINKNITRMSNNHLSKELEEKIKLVSKKILSTNPRVKKKLLRQFFDRIIVLDQYEIKLILKEASDSGALLFEVIAYKKKGYNDLRIIEKLYAEKGMSLNKISDHFNCSRNTIKFRLLKMGYNISYDYDTYPRLEKRLNDLYRKGYSLQKIADKLNLWGVKTRSGKGKWFSKNVNDLISKSPKS